MAKTAKIVLGIVKAVVALGVVAVFGVLIWFKGWLPAVEAPKSFPQVQGELHIAGLEGKVEVIRDKMGVPHIYASSGHDLYFAQGFVHAQERFWQMDFWRHLGSGTLAEMFGKGQIRTDAFLRTLGWARVAKAEWEDLSPGGKAGLQAYVDGVNAWLKDHSGDRASLEYVILGLLSPDYRIAPWTPVDSLTWGKAMAWDLGGNMDDDIARAVLGRTLSPAQVADLYPAYPADYPVIVPKIGENVPAPLSAPSGPAAVSAVSAVSAATPAASPPAALLPGDPRSARALAAGDDRAAEAAKNVAAGIAAGLDRAAANLSLASAVLGQPSPDIGSNSWVVAGSRTATGKPLLANDMHLGIQMPSIWFENDLHSTGSATEKPIDVTGFSFVGVPGVVAGHNARVAWAFTNLGPDVQDLFIEKINPANPDQYEYKGKWINFETRTETLRIAGGKTVPLKVRVSRHGPIISDTYGPLEAAVDPKAGSPMRYAESGPLPDTYAVALEWTALSPGTPFEAIWGFNTASNWKEFREAAKGFAVPPQNLVYADVDGNIGYQTPGEIPIRAKGDGSLPVPGWTGDYDWTGFIPFEKLPWVYNPQSGYIVTANNKASPRDFPYLITNDWDYGQRAERISEMIVSAPGKIDASYITGMQGDATNLNARALLPILLGVKLDPSLSAIRDRVLKNWDYIERADATAPVLFETFWVHLLHDTFAGKLPAAYMPEGGSRWYEVMRNLAAQPDSAWWDDKSTTDKVEHRDDIFARAFAEAVGELSKKYGKDLASLPAWSSLHQATFRNQTLGESGVAFIEELFNRGPFPVGGGKSVVDATGWVVGKGFGVDWLPSEREVVDLSNLDASLAVHTTGESGHAYNKHYDDMIPLWAKVKNTHMWWNRSSVEKNAESTLTLLP